jgi:hypothetical protein
MSTREERFGVLGSTTEGIFFTESQIEGGTVLGPISVEISRQNANLRDIKQRMAGDATNRGATAISAFRYGQRKHSPLQLLLFKWDTESWYGEGIAVRI